MELSTVPGKNASVQIYTILYTAADCISVLVCLFAIVLVMSLRLYKKVVYRLALYQVLAALAFATVGAIQIIFINYNENPEVYRHVCTAIAWLALYTQWVKLVFTTWVTVHLFSFGVLYKNLNKLEALYVVTSLLVPATIASVPLITGTYGVQFDACYIYDRNDSKHVAVIERFALWNGPAIIILLAASATMVVMVIILAHRVCWKSNFVTITDGGQYWRALKQLLPLAAFPLLFFVFVLPVVMFDEAIIRTSDVAQVLIPTLLIPLWSMASGVTLIIHISVALLCTCNKRQRLQESSSLFTSLWPCCAHVTKRQRLNGAEENTHDEGMACRQESCKTDVNSATNFVLPKSSFMEDL